MEIWNFLNTNWTWGLTVFLKLIIDDNIIAEAENIQLYTTSAEKKKGSEKFWRKKIGERVWWPGISVDVHKVVKQWLACALISRPNLSLPLSRSKIPEKVWMDIAIDFFKARDLGELLVVIDYYSQYAVTKNMNGTDADKTIRSLQEIFI